MLLVSALSWAGTCGNGYSFSKAVTLPFSLVATSDQTNYPWVMKGTYPAWATVANGGKVQNTAANTPGVTSPADFIVCDAASAGNAIKFYFKFYDATTGKHLVWLQRATASHTVNATVYVFYGNSGVATSQQDTSLLTDAGYVVSEDNPDGTSLSVTDFSGTQTMTNHSATATGGPIDGAAKTVAASSQYVSAGTPVNPGSSISIETMQYLDSYQPCNVITDNTNMIGATGYLLFWGQPGCPSNEALFFITCPSGCGSLTGKYTGLNLGSSKTWSYVGATMTSTGAANMHIYWDGTEPATTTAGSGGGLGTSANNLSIGRASNNTNYFDGRNGLFRISSVAHSKDWHDTNFNTWRGLCSTYQIVEVAPPFSITQYCGNISASSVSLSIVMPFTVTNGNWLVAGVEDNGNCNTGTLPSDSKTSGWTKQIGTVVGSKGVCWFTAPITSSGADTITYSNGGQVVVYEVQGKPVSLAVDTTGTATVSATSITSSSMTVAQNNSLMFCSSVINASNVSYSGVFAPTTQNFQFGLFNSENPYSATAMSYGVVNAGANTCGFSMGSSSSTILSALVIKGSDVPAASKRRMAQVY
jgi:hypothetical protein